MHVSGDQLAHYRLNDKVNLGRREIWQGVDTRDDRPVTLAVLQHLSDPAARARVEREAEALRSLSHPGVAKIVGVEQAGQEVLVLVDSLDGTSLADLVPRGGFEPERLLAESVKLADAVRAAHEAGVTHRELAPDRVFIDEGGCLRVHGFGLSDAEEGGDDPNADPDDTPTLTLTREGGRRDLAYLAPEQVKNVPLDRRTDIYSVGAILYWMASGVHPFHGESPADLFVAVLRDSPRPVSELRHDVPAGLVPVVARCLEKGRERRYTSAAELHADLVALV